MSDSSAPPGKVFLFSGHMIDPPGSAIERFPVDMEDLAAGAIADRLDELDAGAGDLAVCEGACGGDLLFAQEALDRGMRLELRLPCEEREFLNDSVAFAGPAWIDRYHRIKTHPWTAMHVMRTEQEDGDPHECANLWQLDAALAWGAERMILLALWDGRRSGQPGGTDHMVDTLKNRHGRLCIIDAGMLLRQTIQRRRQLD